MKGWLKFFGLSFFSDKITKQARQRGYACFFIGLLLALTLLFCGLLAGNVLPFTTHYGNAGQFQAFVQAALNNVELTASNGSISAGVMVDTFANESDAAKYSLNGYNLVVDTRKFDTLDDFVAYCVAQDGTEITYEQYLELPKEQQANYTFRIRYTLKELVLTDAITAQQEAFLEEYEGEIADTYKNFKEQKGDLTAEDYRLGVYTLYLQAYYPEISQFVTVGGVVPTLRNYYYDRYVNQEDVCDYLLVFDDLVVGSFHTDSQLPVTFYGFCTNLPDGRVTDAAAFVSNVYNAALSAYANVFVSILFRYGPVVVLTPFVLAILVWGVMRAIRSEFGRRYTTCLKVVGAHLTMSALITALVVFVCGFFTSGSLINLLTIVIFPAVLVVREIFFIVYECRHGDKIVKKRVAANSEHM